jgi:hypothetical protein
MTCRHAPGDPACSSTQDGWRAAEIERENREYREKQRMKEQEELYARTPDVEKYEIEDFTRVGPHVVLKVRYPNCSKCAYEGNKVMVFLNVTEAEMLRWRRIDPHFRDPKSQRVKTSAPPPAARFPASTEGWADALAYAQGKRA